MPRGWDIVQTGDAWRVTSPAEVRWIPLASKGWTQALVEEAVEFAASCCVQQAIDSRPEEYHPQNRR